MSVEREGHAIEGPLSAKTAALELHNLARQVLNCWEGGHWPPPHPNDLLLALSRSSLRLLSLVNLKEVRNGTSA
jgi:hypothetical protein